jgi:phospholipid-binding lipoprotein MlaA
MSPWELELALDTLDVVNRTSFRIGDYERLKDAALDPYSAFRDAYIQHRRMQIKQ